MRLLVTIGMCMLALSLSCMGRTVSAGEADSLIIQINNVKTVKTGGKVFVSMDMILDSLEVSSNRAVRLTPALILGDSVRTFIPVTVAGRRQAIIHERLNRGGQLVRRRDGKAQSVSFSGAVAYAEWMDNATLMLAEDVCGCAESILEQNKRALCDLCLDVPVYEIVPSLAFVAPLVETVKHREESGRAFLDFPVNETVIYPDYRRNVSELEKIRKTVELVRNDTNTVITGIDIHGYASPEGSFARNRKLAQGRAEALRRYVCGQYGFSDSLFSVKSTPEDWDGLRRWVEQSEIRHRGEILEIIGSSVAEDAKNALLQGLGGGTYRYLLSHVYPSLRHSDYTVHYTVRAFSVEEAAHLLRTRPQLLSLDEMFRVAGSYEPGSDEFNEVFDIAVRMFPEDRTANLNAGLVAVSEKSYERAARYAAKAGDSPEAVHLRGLVALMTGDDEGAEELLERARDLGVSQAGENLEKLYLKRENDRRRAEMNVKK